MAAIKLMLVDDHDVVRTGLRAYLATQEGIEVVAEASSGRQALERAVQTQPNVIVMDITMPDMDGLEATRQLKKILPEARILALTVHEDKQYLFEMILAGASGYLTKQAAAEELTSAVRAVYLGNVYLQPTLARYLLDDYRRLLQQSPAQSAGSQAGPPGKGLDILSERERQVLELIANGLTNPQIGTKLGISPKTVARHRERIMNKLDLHTCSDLVKYAIRTGLVGL